MADSRQDYITNPKQVITEWLMNKQLSDRLGSGAQRARAGAAEARGFAFDPAPLAHQYLHPAKPFPARSTQAARSEFTPPASGQGHASPLVGGQFTYGTGNWPAPSPVPHRYVGAPNYWASGPIPPADTGTKWGNSLANSFASAGNVFLNPVNRVGSSIAPYEDDLNALYMTTRGIPGYGKLWSVPIGATSGWIRAARRLDKHALEIAKQKQAGHVIGTPQYLNRLKNDTKTSAFFGEKSGEYLTQRAFREGRSPAKKPTVRDHEFGISVGSGPKGGMQTKVRVHQDQKGRIHGHPAGPERF